jgi:hypothetical protein
LRGLKTSFVLITAVAFLGLAFAPVQAGDADVGLATVDGMPVVVLTGTPEERGTTYGNAVGGMIKDNLAGFWAEAESRGMSKDSLKARALLHESSMPDHMLAELEAMATASGADYAELLAMNMYGSAVRGHDGCTIFAAVDSGSENGNTIASKNRDANSPNILLTVEPLGEKHGFVSVTGAGEWGVSFGLNDVGVCDGNNWMPVPDFYDGGLDELPLNRLVLEDCASVDDAIAYVSSVKKFGGTTVMVADKDSAAFIEAVSSCYSTDDGKDTLWVKIEDGVGVHTNHYTIEPFKSWVAYDDFGYFWVPSVARMDRGNELLAEEGDSFTATDVIRFTRDLYNFGNSQPMEIIEAHPELPRDSWGFGWPGFSICNSRTVSAGVFEIDPDWPEYMSVMWTSINCPSFTPYFPIHNGVLEYPEVMGEWLADYKDGTVWKLIDVIRESKVYDWGELVPLFEELEAASLAANGETEADALALLADCDPVGACTVLAGGDSLLGIEAYELLLSL